MCEKPPKIKGNSELIRLLNLLYTCIYDFFNSSSIVTRSTIIKTYRKIYDVIVEQLDLSSMHCPYDDCRNKGFIFYGTYTRFVNLGIVRFDIQIKRIICPKCHRTHALLPGDLVPYKQVSLTVMCEMIQLLNDKEALGSYLSIHPELRVSDAINTRRTWEKSWKDKFDVYELNFDLRLKDLQQLCMDIIGKPFMVTHYMKDLCMCFYGASPPT